MFGIHIYIDLYVYSFVSNSSVYVILCIYLYSSIHKILYVFHVINYTYIYIDTHTHIVIVCGTL